MEQEIILTRREKDVLRRLGSKIAEIALFRQIDLFCQIFIFYFLGNNSVTN